MNILDLKTREATQLIGQRIGHLRKSSGITLTTLAQITGFDEHYLEGIENHNSDPSVKCVCRIADAFGVDVLFLVAGVGSGTTHLAPALKPQPSNH